MPGMKEVIHKLAGKGLPLGIISNAQFYTPVILNFFHAWENFRRRRSIPV